MAAPTPITKECTQMILLNISVQYDLKDKKRSNGRLWQRALNAVKKAPGFVRLYWGRRVEEPDSVHLHIVRESLQANKDFLNSELYSKNFRGAIDHLIEKEPTIRHAYIAEYLPGVESLGKGAPFTGTAIYLDLDGPKWDAAWHKWTTIIPHVKGYRGIAGGPIVEDVDGYSNCFIALVGWTTIEEHEAYHHTKDFEEKRYILIDPGRSKKRFTRYGHIAFENGESVEGNKGSSKL